MSLKTNYTRVIGQALNVVLIITLLSSQKSGAAVPESLDPRYSSAVIAFNQKHYKDAIHILNQLIAKDDSVLEFYELKALSLKGSSDLSGADELYGKLIELKLKNGATAKDMAPYHFERGLIYYRGQKNEEAEKEFHASADAGFNQAASNYFLGLIHFQSKKFEEAGREFGRVNSGDIDELKPASNFYLGQIYLGGNYPSGAAQSLLQAQRESRKILNNPNIDPQTKETAEKILNMSQESLKPFDRSGFFGNLTLITSDDTNVLSTPSTANSLSSATGPINQGSVKETLQGGVGYMSSPVATWQWTASYRTGFNYDFNQDTISGQFYTHDIGVYLTHTPLAQLSWGFHVDGIYIYQDNVGASGSAGLQSYSLQVPFGPYFRYEIWQRWSLQGSIDVNPQNYYQDSALTASLKRSGTDFSPKISLKSLGVDRIWNPGFALIFDSNGSSGNEYSANSYTFEINNTFHLMQPLDLSIALDYGAAYYSSRPEGARFDSIYVLDLNAVYHLNGKWSILGDIQYFDNISTVPSQFQFTRLIASLGVGYSF